MVHPELGDTFALKIFSALFIYILNFFSPQTFPKCMQYLSKSFARALHTYIFMGSYVAQHIDIHAIRTAGRSTDRLTVGPNGRPADKKFKEYKNISHIIYILVTRSRLP